MKENVASTIGIALFALTFVLAALRWRLMPRNPGYAVLTCANCARDTLHERTRGGPRCCQCSPEP